MSLGEPQIYITEIADDINADFIEFMRGLKVPRTPGPDIKAFSMEEAERRAAQKGLGLRVIGVMELEMDVSLS